MIIELGVDTFISLTEDLVNIENAFGADTICSYTVDQRFRKHAIKILAEEHQDNAVLDDEFEGYIDNSADSIAQTICMTYQNQAGLIIETLSEMPEIATENEKRIRREKLLSQSLDFGVDTAKLAAGIALGASLALKFSGIRKK
jgi:hypothetical protein